MINKERFVELLEKFKQEFKGERWSAEKFKWVAVKHFQENWDIDAYDFNEMFLRATAKTESLLSSRMNFPRGMISEFAQVAPEDTRKMFIDLFDETKDYYERISNFQDEAERLRSTYGLGKWKNHYQGPNAITTYLWLRYPDKYYIYKYSECKSVVKELQLDESLMKGKLESKVTNAKELYDEISVLLKADSEIVELLESCLDEDCYSDKELRTLAIDFGFYISRYMNEDDLTKTKVEEKIAKLSSEEKRYWIYSPGDNAFMWNEFYSAGKMAIGWSKLGDLSLFDSKEQMQEELKLAYGDHTSHKNNALATWQFAKEIKPGDIVFVKKGMFKVVGRGIVTGDYEYQPTAENGEFCHVRSVQWTHKGEWEHDGQAVMKTLTDITQYSDYVERLNAIFEDDNIQVLEEYTKEKFLEDVYMTESDYDTLKHLLESKKNIILQGAPGVGKTYAAERLAYSIMGVKDETRKKKIQFHQNYSYEDFIMGYKPNGEGFELKFGVFYEFCQKAAREPDKKFYFIIDEINRGNMSKIFGELMMLIEKGYRGEKLSLAYGDEDFAVPRNLYLIGMMNTADRSLAMIDYALRRRFSFFTMKPGFDSDGFKKYQASFNNEIFNKLIKSICDLNKAIVEDNSLGDGFQIGHSYFCEQKECTLEWMKEVVEYDIIPMLNEYWFDNKSEVDKWAEILRGVFE